MARVAPRLNSVMGASLSITEDEFVRIRALVKKTTGISLGAHKRDLVVSRLAQRLRSLDMDSFSQYLDFLSNAEDDEELVNMINRITTNKTDFFRENHHFEFLKTVVLPQISENGGDHKIRCWSAGCSSGQEPYSIAITMADFFAGDAGAWDPRILATDLDTNILRKAKEGIYTHEQMEGMPKAQLERYFDSKDGRHQVKPVLQNMITFKKFNFMSSSYNVKVPLDFIFCRNVMIYFDAQDKLDMIKKFARVLKPKGYLFIGHSESLMAAKDMFVNVGPTTYRKV